LYSLPQSYNQTSKCKRCISSNAYDYSLDAADCFVIEMYTKEMLYSDDYEDLIIQFNLGVCCGMPALQNSMTKEVIPIKLNEKRWYNPEDNYIIRFDPWLGYKQ
jgi:hypothetical protein